MNKEEEKTYGEMTKKSSDAKTPFAFNIPELDKRKIHSDSGYDVVSLEGKDVRNGIFKEGQWKGCIRSDGVSEEDNPTSIELEKKRLKESVEKTLSTIKEQLNKQ